MKLRDTKVVFTIASGVLFGLTACGDAGTTLQAEEITATIPTAEALEVSFEDEAEPNGGPDIAPELEDDSWSFRAQARDVALRVNQAVQRLHKHMTDIAAQAEPVELQIGARTCMRWEQDRERYHAKLEACRIDRRSNRYRFRLEGRPLDSKDDAYLTLAAGTGRRLDAPSRASSERGRAVAGRIGYNFDHARELFDNDGPSGRIAIGYRHAGRVRQLALAVDEFYPGEVALRPEGQNCPTCGVFQRSSGEVRSAFHNYIHIAGRGGKLAYTRNSDFLAPNDEGGFEAGQDGLRETGRIALVWSTQTWARAAATVCGGSLGEEECVRVVRCYAPTASMDAAATAVQPLSWEAMASTAGPSTVEWDRSRCATDSIEPGATDLVDLPDDLDDIPGPDIEEPMPSPAE